MKTLPTPIRDELAGFWNLASVEGREVVLKILDFPLEDQGALLRAEERIRFVRFFGELFLAYAYTKVPGRPAQRNDACVQSGTYFRAIGAELGRLHAAWDHLQVALEGLSPHVGNFLIDPNSSADEPELTILDFDVANYHWYLNDCAVALYSFGLQQTGGIETEARPPEGFAKRASGLFWEGYSRHKDPGSLDLDKLELFLQYRRCLLFMPFQEQTALEADRKLFG